MRTMRRTRAPKASARCFAEAFGGFKGRSEVPPLIDEYEAWWPSRLGGSGVVLFFGFLTFQPGRLIGCLWFRFLMTQLSEMSSNCVLLWHLSQFLDGYFFCHKKGQLFLAQIFLSNNLFWCFPSLGRKLVYLTLFSPLLHPNLPGVFQIFGFRNGSSMVCKTQSRRFEGHLCFIEGT